MSRSLALVAAVASAALAGAAGVARGDDSQPVFVESAAELGVDFAHFNGMTGELYFAEHMGSGAALADFDGDGDLDLYLGQGHLLGPPGEAAASAGGQSLRDRLFQNDLDAGELRFTDVTAESGLDARGYAMGAAVGDIDNDGDPDLYILNLGANQLWRNDSERGAIRFTDISAGSNAADPRWSAAASFLDFDADGLLDLFVGNYVEFRVAIHKQCASAEGVLDYCGPKAYQAEANRMLRNLGGGAFEDWTSRLGIADLKRPTLGTVAADFDGDGLLDVYVANDQHANALLLNQAGTGFVDDAALAGAAVDAAGQPQASMGVLAEDLNGDGLVDLFMTHLHRETNTLYVNLGDGLWDDATRSSGLGRPSFLYTGFGTAALDYDRDGELDIAVANGAVKRIDEQFRASEPLPLRQKNQLFRGLGEGRFAEVPDFESPSVAEVSRALAAGDLDNDGDRDLVVANNNGPVRILINEGRPPSEQWAGVDLRLPGEDEATPGRRALGAWVGVASGNGAASGTGAPSGGDAASGSDAESGGDVRGWRRFHTDGSYAAANDPRVAFPAGDGPPAVVVAWPDGERETFRLPGRGRYFTLVRGGGEPAP